MADLPEVADRIIFGISVAAAGAVAYDFRKAIDGTDSAAEPKLGQSLK